MKTMKLALLGTAALAAASVGARADDVAALKAQLEALNARVAQLEAAPAVPAGYQLLTITERDAYQIPGLPESDRSYGKTATVVSILPTADAPASTTIEWSGYVRAALNYVDYDPSTAGTGGDDELDIPSRAEIKVTGKTDTAVGEVGAMMKLRASYDVVNGGNPSVISPEYWGWWAMTPEMTFGGGYSGTLANIGYGYDGACTCYYTDNADVGLNPGDASQLRLTYASGPISMAIAVEDASTGVDTDDSLGVAAEFKYSGDTFNGELSAGWWDDDDFTVSDGVEWQVGAGMGFALGDMASISVAAGMGEFWSGAEYWGASILASFNLTDAVRAELAYGHKDYDSVYADTDAVLAGLYYEPVSQLVLGLEGEWIDTKGGVDSISVDFVTKWSF
jgi:hypothetical protein